MIWFDNRLEWNPAEYNNITEITLAASELWVKSFFLINSERRANAVYLT